MKKKIDFICWICGIIIFVSITIIDKKIGMSDKLFAILCFIAIFLEIPMIVKEVKSVIYKK